MNDVGFAVATLSVVIKTSLLMIMATGATWEKVVLTLSICPSLFLGRRSQHVGMALHTAYL